LGLLIAWGLVALSVEGRPVRAEESMDGRRHRVEAMDQAAKEQLLRRLEYFNTLSPEQQQRLRRLNETLEREPQADELRRVMSRYYDWLKTLKPFQKAELADLAPRERVERIKKLLQEQSRKEAKRASGEEGPRVERLKKLLQEQMPKIGKRLTVEDLEGLVRWTEQYVTTHESQLIEELPEPRRKEARLQLAKIREPERRREVLAGLWLRTQMADLHKVMAISVVELADLRTRLSPATRQRLEAFPEAEQQRTVSLWLRLVLLHYVAVPHRPPTPGEVSDQELAEFLEHQLNPEARDRLLGLPPEEMQRELWSLYLRSKSQETTPVGRLNRGKQMPRPNSKKSNQNDHGGLPRPNEPKGSKGSEDGSKSSQNGHGGLPRPNEPKGSKGSEDGSKSSQNGHGGLPRPNEPKGSKGSEDGSKKMGLPVGAPGSTRQSEPGRLPVKAQPLPAGKPAVGPSGSR
jgi:hypothetical protein